METQPNPNPKGKIKMSQTINLNSVTNSTKEFTESRYDSCCINKASDTIKAYQHLFARTEWKNGLKQTLKLNYKTTTLNKAKAWVWN